MAPAPIDPKRSEDEALLRRFLAGDAAAHRTIAGWAREIVRFRPYGIPRDAHDDVVQSSLGQMWTACSRPDFELRHGVRAMIRTIVLARCVDHLRRRRPTVELEETLPDPAPGPEEATAASDHWSRVQRAIAQVDARCREIIRLHFLDGLAYAELAGRMGHAPATVRVRMFHCMKEIRRLLDHEDGPAGR
jgi:RNA polymerase sigma-70 factor, ECF subfamily